MGDPYINSYCDEILVRPFVIRHPLYYQFSSRTLVYMLQIVGLTTYRIKLTYTCEIEETHSPQGIRASN